MTWIYAISSVVIVSLISLVGVVTLLLRENILHKILLFLVSFAAGALLGDAFLHLIPEASQNGFSITVSLYILLGIIIFFILEKFIQWRHCHHVHLQHEHHPGTKHRHIHPVAYINLVGDGFHNFLDGVIIGGSYLVSLPLGITTTLAVVLHEIPQEIGDFGIFLHSGMEKKKAILLNVLSAFIALLGTVIVLLIGTKVGQTSEILIPFTAGSFIYIATADLIPELQKETKPIHSFVQLLAFLFGISIMLLLFLQFE